LIPEEAKNHFFKVVEHEMVDMDRALDQTMAATTGKAAMAGMGHSSNLMVQLREDARNSLKSRAHYIFGQLLRCLAAHNVALDSKTVSAAASLIEKSIMEQSTSLEHKLLKRPGYASGGLNGASGKLLADFNGEAPRLIDKLKTELELAAAANRSVSKTGPNITINGPVGLVQTGDGSHATVHQHIDAGVKQQVVSALDICLQELDKPENSSIGNLHDLKGLVIDTKTEAERPHSNNLKIASGLRSIAESIKFVGSLGPAYQVVKPLLSYFGVHLP
jgi:hypothetical protein